MGCLFKNHVTEQTATIKIEKTLKAGDNGEMWVNYKQNI